MSSRRGGASLAAVVRAVGAGAKAGTVTDAAQADVVVLAVPWNAVEAAVKGVRFDGRVLVDATNPVLPGFRPANLGGRASSEVVAALVPDARLVKAFNTLGANMLGNSVGPDGRIGVPIAGDDADAVQIVRAVVRDAGFDPVLVGPLARAKEFDRGTPVWVTGMTGAEVRQALGLPPDS